MCKSQPDRDRGSGSRRGGGRSSASKWSKAPQGGTHARACQRSLLLGSSPRPYALLFPSCLLSSLYHFPLTVCVSPPAPSLSLCVCVLQARHKCGSKSITVKNYIYMFVQRFGPLFLFVPAACLSAPSRCGCVCVCVQEEKRIAGAERIFPFYPFLVINF